MKFLSLTLLLVTIAFAMAAPQQAVESAPEQAELSASQSTTEEITTPVAKETTTPAAEEVTSKFSPENIKNIFKSLFHKTKGFIMNNAQHFIH